MERIDPPLEGAEQEMLTAFLDFQRATIVKKAEGLSDAEAGVQSVSPSTLSIGALVKHMALVEAYWFRMRFLGGSLGEPWDSAPFDQDRDWEFNSAHEDRLTDLIDLYETACARSREIVAAAPSLDELSQKTTSRDPRIVSLRWILIHMIEETARHAGHADLIREAIDGSTGQ